MITDAQIVFITTLYLIAAVSSVVIVAAIHGCEVSKMDDLDRIRDEIIELSEFDSYTPFQQQCNKILQMIDDYAASCKQPIQMQKCLNCPWRDIND